MKKGSAYGVGKTRKLVYNEILCNRFVMKKCQGRYCTWLAFVSLLHSCFRPPSLELNVELEGKDGHADCNQKNIFLQADHGIAGELYQYGKSYISVFSHIYIYMYPG